MEIVLLRVIFPKIQKAKMSVKSAASIEKGKPFRKNHSFLPAIIREILTSWEYLKPIPNWSLSLYLSTFNVSNGYQCIFL